MFFLNKISLRLWRIEMTNQGMVCLHAPRLPFGSTIHDSRLTFAVCRLHIRRLPFAVCRLHVCHLPSPTYICHMPDNYFIAQQFSMLAKLMDIHGENSFKAKSYSITAFNIEKLPVQLSDLPPQKIFSLKGIGESIGKKYWRSSIKEASPYWKTTC